MARGFADGVYPPVCRAAVITEVGPDQNVGHEGYVGIAVLNPAGLFFHACDYSETKEPGTWHWPERVDD